MRKLKEKLQEFMKGKVEFAISNGVKQDRAAIESPYFLGIWFYEPEMPNSSNE